MGERRRGAIVGDANAAIGIVRRLGLGKVRRLQTNMLWVQEKQVNKELEYNTIKGTENPADMFTKALDENSILKFTKLLDYEIIDAEVVEVQEDEKKLAAGINFIGGMPTSRQVEEMLEQRLGDGRGYKAWLRTDLGTNTKKTTLRGGPAWNKVIVRITSDALTGETMAYEDKQDICRALEHGRFPGPPRDTTTTLVYADEDVLHDEGPRGHPGADERRGHRAGC